MSDVMVPYVTRKVGDTDIKFGKLSPRNRAEILRRLKDERRPKLLEALDKAGITGKEFFNEVDAFDEMPLGVDELVRYLNGPVGQDEALTIACRKQNGDKADQILDQLTLDHQDTTSLAFELAGIKVMFVQPSGGRAGQGAEPEASEPERPSEPAASNQ